jgi:hypothetical protein
VPGVSPVGFTETERVPGVFPVAGLTDNHEVDVVAFQFRDVEVLLVNCTVCAAGAAVLVV